MISQEFKMSLETRLKARGFLHHSIFKIRPIYLWLGCFGVYTALVFIFSLLYQYYGIDDGSNLDKGLLLHFYYSVTVQTTIGFGDITPTDSSMIIYIVHSFIAFFSNALLLGILVSSFLQRKNNVKCSDHISYNPKKDNLTIWLMNMDHSNIMDIKFTFGIIRHIKDNNNINKIVRYPVKVKYNPTFVENMMGFLMITDSSEALDEKQVWVPRSNHENFFSISAEIEDNKSIFNDNEKIEFLLEVRAKSVDTGNDIFLHKIFQTKDIVCGEYMDLTDCRKDYDIWAKRKMNRFGKYVKESLNYLGSKSDKCRSCQIDMKLHNGCSFKEKEDNIAKKLVVKEKVILKKGCLRSDCEYNEQCKFPEKLKVY